MDDYTRCDWVSPTIYDKHGRGFIITDKTFNEAINLVKITLGTGYRITHADNGRSSFTFKQYKDGLGISGEIDTNSGVTWVCRK